MPPPTTSPRPPVSGPLHPGWRPDGHPGAVRRQAALASALASRWTQTAEGLVAGEVNVAQARVIVEVLDELPTDLGDDLRAKAEAYLVEQAEAFGPRELRHLAAVSSNTSPPRSPTRPSTSGCSPTKPAPPPPPDSTSDPEATGPPTSTQGSPTTSRTGCVLPRRVYLSAPHPAWRGRRTTGCAPPRRRVRRVPGEPPRIRPATEGGTTTSAMVAVDLDRPSSRTRNPASQRPPPATR